MKTKAFNSFRAKVIYFDDDIDLIDVIRLSMIEGDLSEDSGDHALKRLNPQVHKHLLRRKNSGNTRKNIANHLRKTVYSAYIKDIYEELTNYLKTILEQAAENGFEAKRLIGEHSMKFNANDILNAGNWVNVSKMVADSVFQSLESERSTLKLLSKIDSKLALGVDTNVIDQAIPFLETRHYLVHADGKIPNDFVQKNPQIPVTGEYLKINLSFINDFRNAVNNLVSEFDNKVVAANIISANYMAR